MQGVVQLRRRLVMWHWRDCKSLAARIATLTDKQLEQLRRRSSSRCWLLLLLLGLGPLGAAFLLWDKALKLGDVRHVGLLSYLTPLASTTLLMQATGRTLSWHIALAAGLIIGAALLGMRRT